MRRQPLDLVFLPGLSSDAQVWRHQLTIFRKLYSVQVIPLVQFSCLRKMIAYVLSVVPEQFVLIGHSLGGWIAIEVMKCAAKKVKGLILLNTTARPESHLNKIWRKNLIQRAKKEHFKKVILPLMPIYLPSNETINKDLHDELLKMFLRLGRNVFIRQQKIIINRPGSLYDLKKIKCPTLIIHAENDKIMDREMQEEMQKEISNSRIESIENCGHFSMLNQPREVSNIMKYWLSKHI